MIYKRAVIIYGPPGAGKGTQAELLARKFGFIHFDTGRFIENVVHGPHVSKDKILKRERYLFDTGKLCTPSWVLRIVKQETQRIAKAGYSVVFSGSPRTMYEVFGDRRESGLIKTLADLYGKNNITVVWLKIKPTTTVWRNSHRVICSVCGLPMLRKAKHPYCAFCGGSMRKRTLDAPNVIKVRLQEYRERTYPIIARLKKLGYRIKPINGEPSPYIVFGKVLRALEAK
ncbi:nucleoside monophosphate kinase [Candidatus Jorgensenbacteria bacterium]|nr:nucleoside monophosphate kinase [Candidatus Jorgensenbacteria bacterium]